MKKITIAFIVLLIMLCLTSIVYADNNNLELTKIEGISKPYDTGNVKTTIILGNALLYSYNMNKWDNWYSVHFEGCKKYPYTEQDFLVVVKASCWKNNIKYETKFSKKIDLIEGNHTYIVSKDGYKAEFSISIPITSTPTPTNTATNTPVVTTAIPTDTPTSTPEITPTIEPTITNSIIVTPEITSTFEPTPSAAINNCNNKLPDTGEPGQAIFIVIGTFLICFGFLTFAKFRLSKVKK